MHNRHDEQSVSVLRAFLDSEAAGGMLLVAAAVAAIVVANSGAADVYRHLLHLSTGPALSPKLGPMTVHGWINDALMAVFFLLVGLEIKREFLCGRLSTWERRRLPVIAAAAGMAVPALVYLVVAREPTLTVGWAIPAATDIAFALGVLALLGSRVPASLKLFLTTVAIADDLGAIAIIATAYTGGLELLPLAVAAGLLLLMLLLGRIGVTRLAVFLPLAILLWYAVLLSGVHATVAGVLAAATVPIAGGDASPLHRLEHALAAPVAYLILPLFAFANAGVSLSGLGLSSFTASLPLAIAAGLFLGKQLGIFGALWLCARLGIGRIADNVSWLQVYGIALLCGIGFTMSLFIAGLAFVDSVPLVEEAKMGILIGSFASALAGYAILRFAPAGPAD
jgi:NhaA family Na+:H+ antiporter